MRYLLFAPCLLLLWCNMLFAGENEYEGVPFTYNDELSIQDFSKRDFTAELIPRGTTVYASFFSRETPDSEVFHPNMTGVTFILCHLDNVVMPAGNIQKSYKVPIRYKSQNDLRDWILDSESKPLKLIDEEYWDEKGYSIDPKDIPAEPIDHPDKIPMKKP